MKVAIKTAGFVSYWLWSFLVSVAQDMNWSNSVNPDANAKALLLKKFYPVSFLDLLSSRKLQCGWNMNEDGTFLPNSYLCRPQGSYKSCDVQKYFTRFGKQYPFTNRGGLWGPN